MLTVTNKHVDGNMRHVFDGAKLFILNARCVYVRVWKVCEVRAQKLLPRQKHVTYYRDGVYCDI